MALSANQAVGSAAATIQKAKLKRQQGGMATGKPQVKPAARMAPDGINKMSDDGKFQTAMGPITGGMMPRGVRLPPSLPTGMQGGGMSPGAQGGGSPPQGPPGGNQNLMSLLPPKMQAAMAQNGRDPREAIATRMQNDPVFQAKMMQSGFPGGPPPGMSLPMQPPPGGPRIDAGGDQVQVPGGAPGLGGGPDSAVSGMPGQGPGGPPPPPPPGADMGGQMQVDPGFGTAGQAGMKKLGLGGMQGGFGFGGMDPQQLRQMLPPAMQQGLGGFAGNPQGMNLQSLQLAQQGGGPAPGAQLQRGSFNPFQAYQGL